MDLIDLNAFYRRARFENNHLDQAFVSLAGHYCVSTIHKIHSLDHGNPMHPIIDTSPSAIDEALHTGVFAQLRSYIDSLRDPSSRSTLAGKLLGSAQSEADLSMDTIQLQRELTGLHLITAAESLCSELDHRPVVHLLASEVQVMATEILNAPESEVVGIHSSFAQLKPSGLLGAAHALAESGDYHAAESLLASLYRPC